LGVSRHLRLDSSANPSHFHDLSRLELLIIAPALRRPSRREKVLSYSPGASLCAGLLNSCAGPSTQRLLNGSFGHSLQSASPQARSLSPSSVPPAPA
jgi:hypothetical protein